MDELPAAKYEYVVSYFSTQSSGFTLSTAVMRVEFKVTSAESFYRLKCRLECLHGRSVAVINFQLISEAATTENLGDIEARIAGEERARFELLQHKSA